MILYYTDWYDSSKRPSHGLLEDAVRAYLTDCGSSEDPEAEAKECLGRIRRGAHGKPTIPGFPAFSLSHSGSWWGVLIGGSEPVGLDLQVPRPVGTDQMKIAERFFDPADAEAVRQGGEEVFWRIWVRREALIKALGTTVISPVPAVFGVSPVACGGADWFCREISPDGSVYGAVCTKTPAEIRLRKLIPEQER
ncbi:MAG: 4'-phosphopantetheinyl transferase superfamily protein [Mogibacterium sp.]|nr:4'-phosphopantetheinyl transferase superfamily protein [Mogibacterium sp.]